MMDENQNTETLEEESQELENEEGAVVEETVEAESSSEVEPEADSEGDEVAVSNPRLVVKRNGAETDEVFMIHPPATIGRFDPSVGPIDIDLGKIEEGEYVSRKHAEIIEEDGQIMINDLGSSNGTYVKRDGDFEKISEPFALENGDEVALGNARFVYYS